jgi:hypothetical protein
MAPRDDAAVLHSVGAPPQDPREAAGTIHSRKPLPATAIVLSRTRGTAANDPCTLHRRVRATTDVPGPSGPIPKSRMPSRLRIRSTSSRSACDGFPSCGAVLPSLSDRDTHGSPPRPGLAGRRRARGRVARVKPPRVQSRQRGGRHGSAMVTTRDLASAVQPRPALSGTGGTGTGPCVLPTLRAARPSVGAPLSGYGYAAVALPWIPRRGAPDADHPRPSAVF